MPATTRRAFHGRNLVRCARRRAQPRPIAPTGIQDSRATTVVRTDRRLHRPMGIAGTARPDPITGRSDPARAHTAAVAGTRPVRARIAAGPVPIVGVRARVAVLAGPPAAATPMADR